MDNNLRLAELLFPDVDKTPDYYESLYPARDLPEGAKVTRFAPSPTGFMHLGNMFSCLIDYLAAGKNGVFYLRIEDTDKKREVEGAIPMILAGLETFGIMPTEGINGESSESGAYGPYKQSLRCEIYHCYAKELVKKGLAYPCFCSEESLGEMRERQESVKANPGYYGEWAVCRALSYEQIEAKLEAGEPYVLRLKSDGDESRRVFVDDVIKGKLEMPENIQDAVILKSDGIPPYPFAHAVDDHLMRTTHVVRGDEWIASLPLHLQLFKALGFKPPKYVHISPIMKLDNGNKRKLSKRKDPELGIGFYIEAGYPRDSVIEYLMTIANSNFEDWRRANPGVRCDDFPFNLKKMSPSGAIFDIAKLSDVSKNVISLMPAAVVYDETAKWARAYAPDFYEVFTRDEAFSKAVLSIDREGPKPRKDIAKWDEVRDYVSYFYDELYTADYTLPENIAEEDAAAILDEYIKVFDINDDKDGWFAKIKTLCEPLGYTPNVKEFKQNPCAFKGHVGDVSSVIRIAVTSRRNTPDLYSIMRLLGSDKVLARLSRAKEKYSK